MSIATFAKKKIFDIAKKNKAFRVAARGGRDMAWRVKMFLDEPAGKVDEKKVYFQTFAGRGYSDSPKAMYLYMLNAPEYKDYKFVWCFKEPEKFVSADKNLKSEYVNSEKVGRNDRDSEAKIETQEIDYGFTALKNNRTEIVKFGSKADNKALRTSKYWIANYRMLDHQHPRKNQVYVQCWHGTPLKRLGYDLEASDNSMNSIQEIRDKYRTDAAKFSYILSPSPFCTDKFGSAWNLRETGQMNKIIEEGYPRNDRLINSTPEERSELRKALGVDDKKVILYAPTWRDNQHTSGTGYTYKTELDFDRMKREFGDEYVILFRAHYLVANSFDFEKYKGFVVDVSDYSDINELYIAADLLITDYSSVFFDYANLRKPMIFYMYDLEQYANELRGFYISLEELPGPIVQTEDALVVAIKSCEIANVPWTAEGKTDVIGADFPDEKYAAFCAKYNPKDDGKASARVLKKIIKR